MTQLGEEDLQQLRTVDQADVYKAGHHAATLTRTEDGVEFCYLDRWITAGVPAVATTLPVEAEPVVRSGGALPAYFAGLLPEGRRLGALRRAVKTSADDELTLLLAVGADAIGDVQVVPSGVRPVEVPARVALERVGDISFAGLLIELGIRAQRVALPGVQDKTSAAMINLPVARAGERYILKLNPAQYPHLVENEAFFLAAARTSGLNVPRSEIVTDAEGQPGLLVRRFDRITVDGSARLISSRLASDWVCRSERCGGFLSSWPNEPISGCPSWIPCRSTAGRSPSCAAWSITAVAGSPCRAAALGIATILKSTGFKDRDRFAGRHVVTIVCGSNVDVDAYHGWVGTRSLGGQPFPPF
ncbi:MAG: HipA N-terminal domain-containing protein [Mycobacteriales bacterium]